METMRLATWDFLKKNPYLNKCLEFDKAPFFVKTHRMQHKHHFQLSDCHQDL